MTEAWIIVRGAREVKRVSGTHVTWITVGEVVSPPIPSIEDAYALAVALALKTRIQHTVKPA